MMELLLKIVAGGLSAAVCAVVLRRSTPEFTVPIILACGGWIILLLAQSMEQSVQTLGRLARLAQLDEQVVEPVIKIVGLSIVTRIGTEICRSTGEGGIGAFIEIAGTILSLAAAIPLVNGVVTLITELAG